MNTNSYPWPSGLVGEIADFIFRAAPRPVHEIALVGALGFMAGICGRAYNVSGTGLNQYFLLLAATGTGKEAIASGIGRLQSALQQSVPAAYEFVGPSTIASEQALIKHLASVSPCFVSIMSEFGLVLRQLCAPNANATQVGFRRILLDLYNKSGHGHTLNQMIYSDKQKNTPVVHAPAFSILGESTQESFYTNLNEHMIAEGFLPRFMIIEYTGKRPSLSQTHAHFMPCPRLITCLTQLMAGVLKVMQEGKTIEVQSDENGLALLNSFNDYCDEQINNAKGETVRQLYNRAHIKALKLAALVAVGNNPYQPIISSEIAMWATKIADADARSLLLRFEAGAIGKDNIEARQQEAMVKAIFDYVSEPFEKFSGYGVPPALHKERVIPLTFLHRKLHKALVFKDDRAGPNTALQRAIRNLMDQGALAEINPSQRRERFEFNGRCFSVAEISIFDHL